jgi:hypothetical protein
MMQVTALRFLAIFLFAAALAQTVPAQTAPAQSQTCKSITLDSTDGVVASPANHKVLIETDDIRVLEVTSAPHTAEKIHTHLRPAVMITDGFSTGSLIVEGQPPVMHRPSPDNKPRIVFLPPQSFHHAENLGDTPFHAIRIELKHPGCSFTGQPPAALDATDAVTAAPLSHKVLIDNADVRVLDVMVPPHTKEPMHTHVWPSVMYVYQNSTIRYSTPGNAGEPSVPPANWKPAPRLLKPEGLHSVENLGDTPYHAIRVEFKLASPDPSLAPSTPASAPASPAAP